MQQSQEKDHPKFDELWWPDRYPFVKAQPLGLQIIISGMLLSGPLVFSSSVVIL